MDFNIYPHLWYLSTVLFFRSPISCGHSFWNPTYLLCLISIVAVGQSFGAVNMKYFLHDLSLGMRKSLMLERKIEEVMEVQWIITYLIYVYIISYLFLLLHPLGHCSSSVFRPLFLGLSQQPPDYSLYVQPLPLQTILIIQMILNIAASHLSKPQTLSKDP